MRQGHQVGDRVYVKDKAFVWLPATILACEKDRVQVKLELPPDFESTTQPVKNQVVCSDEQRWVDLNDYRDRLLPLQNDKEKSTRDMADLPHLHEAAILYQIKERHGQQRPYTRVGEIVVAVNPCQWIKDLYSVHQGILYAKNFVWQLEACPSSKSNISDEKKDNNPIASTSFGSMYDKLGVEPHIYEVSALAYRGMFLDRKDQTILVSGESGAGKTETVKIVLHHLATLETASLLVDNDEWPTDDMIEHIVASSPVFEAFGNAKTVRNHNSSRFGKMTRLHFGFSSNGMCGLRGSTCQTYLLETNRVVSQSPGERNFHIFYQLLASSSITKKELLGEAWEHAQSTDFLYLNGVPSTVKDANTWKETKEALEYYEWKGEKLKSLCQALASILRLGNIKFTEDHESDGCVASSEHVAMAAENLGLPLQTLDHALRHKIIQTSGERVEAKLSPVSAKDGLDTLVRKMYDLIFQEILKSVNKQTMDKDFQEKDGIINLLDIYGFEAFETNRFEQLCINYANEMLHKKYLDDNFRRFKDEYEKEGIELFDFSTVDNADVLELLEGRKGVINMLNEECVIPNGSSENFVQKFKKDQKGHDRLIAGDLLARSHFGIKHFAAPVVYDASHFVERNMHRLPSELLHVMSKSSNEMISTYFKSVLLEAAERQADPGRKRASKKKAVLERFRLDLHDLMESMKDTETRYIRCVKPNEMLSPDRVDHGTVMRQLQCAGLVTAIDLSRETYPNKLALTMVVERFAVLMSPVDRSILDELLQYDKVQYILSKSFAPLLEVYRNCEFTMPYACGKTKVYFRAGALEMLESLRFEFYSTRATVVQTIARVWLAKRKVQRAWKGLVGFQARARGISARDSFRSMTKVALISQSTYRGKKARKDFLRQRNAAVLIQTRWRFIMNKKMLETRTKACIVVVSFFRTVRSRSQFLRKRLFCTRLQALIRGRIARKCFNYVLYCCVIMQSFARCVIASRRLAEKRDFLRKVEMHRSAILIQSQTRRLISTRTAIARRDAVCTLSSFLKGCSGRIRFMKMYMAVIKLQSIFRMGFVKMRFTMIKDAIVKVQSFSRMVPQRIKFITIYMATLRLQAFFRMSSIRHYYGNSHEHGIHRILSSDMSEIYTIATNGSRDKPQNSPSTNTNAESSSHNISRDGPTANMNAESCPQNPATGILRQWMAGTFGKMDTDDDQDVPHMTSSRNVKATPCADVSSSESVPSVEEASETCSCTSSEQEKVREIPYKHTSPVKEEAEKDRLIRTLRSELEDMKMQESILREEIAAVVDNAKEHEQMVDEEFEDRVQAYEEEVVNLKDSLRQSELEKESLKKQLQEIRKKHSVQLEALQQQAQATQDSHKEYINKVSAVLDQVNEARKRETEKILHELDALKHSKIAEVERLKKEVESLKASKNMSGRGMLLSGKTEDDVEVDAELVQLQKAIMAAIKPSRVATVVERANRRPWAKETFIDEKLSLRVGQYVSRLVEIAASNDNRSSMNRRTGKNGQDF